MKRVCCFIGHRKLDETEEFKREVANCIKELANMGIKSFLLGSNSEFDTLCHNLLSELKNENADIERIAYTCKGDVCFLDCEKDEWIERFRVIHKSLNILTVEREVCFEGRELAGRASYVERNKAMIDASDICVFYYNPKYIPQTKKHQSKKSGTKIAYDYAQMKGKYIINLYKEKTSNEV